MSTASALPQYLYNFDTSASRQASAEVRRRKAGQPARHQRNMDFLSWFSRVIRLQTRTPAPIRAFSNNQQPHIQFVKLVHQKCLLAGAAGALTFGFHCPP
jgi:hypothetical protein